MQFEAFMESNGWDKGQAKTALTLSLRDQALTVLEALGKEMSYDQLIEALDSRYGDTHLEYVFRAQLKDRVQRGSETLQQWAVEVEKLVRKAYQSTPVLIDGNLVQAFIDGIRDLEVRAAVRLGHHRTLKDALAHALEVEAVRQDYRAYRIREVVLPTCYLCGEEGHFQVGCARRSKISRERVIVPRCYICGKRGHFQASCWRKEDGKRRMIAAPRCYICGERGHLRMSCPKQSRSRACFPSRPCSENWRKNGDDAYSGVKQEAKEAVPVRMLTADLNDVRNSSSERVGQSAKPTYERMKSRYDCKTNNKGFDEGSLVRLNNPVRVKGKSSKLRAKCNGPYRAATKINDVTYRIQQGPIGAPKPVHVDRLACYYGSNDACSGRACLRRGQCYAQELLE